MEGGKIKIDHNVKIYKNGELIKEVKNTTTKAGLAEIVRLIGSGLTGEKFGYVAVGTDNTAATSDDTALGSEVMRESATVTQETTNFTGDTLQLDTTFSFSASYTIQESGVFNASSGGDMLARSIIGPISVENGTDLRIVWTITLQ